MPIPVPQAGRPTRRVQPAPASPSSGAQAGGHRRLGSVAAGTEQEQAAADLPPLPAAPSRRIVPPRVVTGLAGPTGSTHTRIAGLRGPIGQRSSPLPQATESAPEPVSPIVAAAEEEGDDADAEEGAEAGEDDDEEDEDEEERREEEAIEDDIDDEMDEGTQQGVSVNTTEPGDKASLEAPDEEAPGSGSGGGSGQWQGGSFGGVSTDTGEETEVDPETEVETETDSPVITGPSEPARKTARISDAPPTSTSPTRTRTTRGSDREKRAQEEKDKAKMPPPPRRALSTKTKPLDSKPRSTTTTAPPTGGLGRATSVRRGTVTKESGATSGKESTKPTAASTTRTAEPSKSALERKKSVSAATATAPAAPARHVRTRSTATKPSTPPVSFSANSARTPGTDSEDPSAAKKTAVTRTGVARKPRPASTILPSTKPSEKEDRTSPPSPTHTRTRSTTITRDTNPAAAAGRKPSSRSTTAPAATTAATGPSSRRTQSSETPTSTAPTNARPAFTTLQKDFSAPPPPPPSSTQTSIHNNALLPDAPTLQKQTHLLQLLLLHNTAISSFHSLHADARTKLEGRYNALAEKYRAVSAAENKVARAANLAVLRRVLEEPPNPTPTTATIDPSSSTATSSGGRLIVKPTTSNRRKTLAGDVATHVEERIQILSEGIKRLEGLLRKNGDVAKLRAQWEAWFRSPAQGTHDAGLPRQWQKDYLSVRRKVEGAVEGLREFWSGYQRVLDVVGDGSASAGASAGASGGGGATLGRIVLGYLELGEDVVREFEEMRALERVLVEEGRERIRRVVREVMLSDVGVARNAGVGGGERDVPAWM
ncbi:hypothetical protein DFH27DRAFT_540605 [Peziza echinospora]|nr:hypothetical protein DFH27DRAFT_540605 [Peziza echinospora]